MAKAKITFAKGNKEKSSGGMGKTTCIYKTSRISCRECFFPSPFEEAAILTMDGVGEWDTATIGIGNGNQMKLIKSLQFPHSLGLLYSAFTYFCGFKVNSGEYKLMGLAPYGKPVFRDKIIENLINLKEDGSFVINLEYFNYCQGLTMTNHRFAKLFGGQPRKAEEKITEREIDLASSIQAVTEEIVFKMAKFAREETAKSNLCLSGGVALNCVANGKLQASKIFENIWIQPASGDAGGALGAALFTNFQLLKRERIAKKNDSMKGSYLGPRFENQEISQFLKKTNAPSHFFWKRMSCLMKYAMPSKKKKLLAGFRVEWSLVLVPLGEEVSLEMPEARRSKRR